jgi:hypothetical protein
MKATIHKQFLNKKLESVYTSSGAILFVRDYDKYSICFELFHNVCKYIMHATVIKRENLET